MEPTSSNASAKVISALIIGLIVGFVAGAFWQERRLGPAEEPTAAATSDAVTMEGKSAPAAEVKDTKTAAEKKVEVGKKTAAVATAISMGSVPKLSVANQAAGEHAFVAVSGVTEPVWIAVREEKDGKAGNILGARKVFADSADVDVTLLRPTVAGGTYGIFVYIDKGDASFNHKEDLIIEEGHKHFTAN